MQLKEFTVSNRKELFRIGKITPIELLSISAVMDLEKLTQVTEFITFALEHVEVQMGEKWLPLKTKDKEIYMPIGIEEDILSLNEIVAFVLKEVIEKAFTKSSESAQNLK